MATTRRSPMSQRRNTSGSTALKSLSSPRPQRKYLPGGSPRQLPPDPRPKQISSYKNESMRALTGRHEPVKATTPFRNDATSRNYSAGTRFDFVPASTPRIPPVGVSKPLDASYIDTGSEYRRSSLRRSNSIESIPSRVSVTRSRSNQSKDDFLLREKKVASKSREKIDMGRDRDYSTMKLRKSNFETSVCRKGLVGLRNLGNTCFMNSMLQCLSQTRLLTDFFVSDKYETKLNAKSHMKGRLVRAYADLVKRMWSEDESSPLSPTEFKSQIQRFAPRFVGYSQQDAQEFLRFLLDGLHDDLRNESANESETTNSSDSDLASEKYHARENSKIADLFVGQLMSTVTFESCSHQSITYDPFWDLSLPIPRRKHSSSSSSYGSFGFSTSLDSTLGDCFELFTKPETLDGDNSPFCSKCNKKRTCTKRLTLSKLPPILVIHLKRFGGLRYRAKIPDVINFPVEHELKLDRFLASNFRTKGGECLYKLYAVSNHTGSIFGGHYTATCKHYVTGEWHLFNDSNVRRVEPTSVSGSQCYVLFYEKCQY